MRDGDGETEGDQWDGRNGNAHKLNGWELKSRMGGYDVCVCEWCVVRFVLGMWCSCLLSLTLVPCSLVRPGEWEAAWRERGLKGLISPHSTDSWQQKDRLTWQQCQEGGIRVPGVVRASEALGESSLQAHAASCSLGNHDQGWDQSHHSDHNTPIHTLHHSHHVSRSQCPLSNHTRSSQITHCYSHRM